MTTYKPKDAEPGAVYLAMSKDDAKLLYFVVLQEAQLPLTALSDPVISVVRRFRDELAKALH